MAKILIVEDNALNIKLFCDLLAAHGHQPQAVTDSRLALDSARTFGPDLVITDIQLPHVSGLELIRLLRADKELGKVPIMAVTAYAAQGDEEKIRGAGAQSYVSKPISVMKFVAAVQDLLPKGQKAPADEKNGVTKDSAEQEPIDDTAEIDDPESWANEEVDAPGPQDPGGEEDST